MSYTDRIAEIQQRLGIPLDHAKSRGIDPQIEADEASLVSVGQTDDGRPIRLIPAAGQAWAAMRDAASKDGISLVPVSGFRSVARQEEIIRKHLADGRTLEDILRQVMVPGYSEHHTGCAIDITAPDDPPLEQGFALTTAYVWLTRHASSYGFKLSYPRDNSHGIVYEPWHWCWHAPVMM